ncbi:uncharacterized protein LOC127241752 isoform X2 [Andrographis paniculata]|uniref:uncharacterized protein LOC127241752 isoform X2 n=1 Tax=Andrographis paniculata TaxID=175694 RepID=UPI0021E94B96|nr:uncharacterized protein LOC127241752 isoform X2 [Andrographis paniculata]
MRECIYLCLIASCLMAVSMSLPFIVLHGLGDNCSNGNVETLRRDLADLSKSQGFCLEIGSGSNDSWLKPLTEQVQIACDKVKQMAELKDGYNIVGQSQGNMVARGLVQECDGGPAVRNYVSLAGPHAGVASVPNCGNKELCKILAWLIRADVYLDFVQDTSTYLKKSKFLPILNNERPESKNSVYKQRFTSLQNLILIMFENDTVLFPKETSWFGFYPDGGFNPVLPPQQTLLYIEDWIGLKTLDGAGKVKYIRVPGGHLQISRDDLIKYVVPYVTA